MKLLARHDPHAALFDAYAGTVAALAEGRRAATPGGAARLRARPAARDRPAARPRHRDRVAPAGARRSALPRARRRRRRRDRATRTRRRSAARRSSALRRRSRADLTSLQQVAAGALAELRPLLRAQLHYHLGTSQLRTRQVMIEAQALEPMNPLVTTGQDRRRGTTALSVNVNKIALLRNQRAAGDPERRRPVAHRARGGRARHHRAPAARRAPHPRRRRPRARRAAEGLARRRAQHRRQPVPEPDAARARAAPASVHLRSRRRGAGDLGPRLGPRRRRRPPGAARRRGARARHPGQPVHGRRSGRDGAGAGDRRRPRRALHRAVRAGLGHADAGSDARRASARAARAAQRVGLGVNAGHDLNRDNLGAFLAAVPGVLEVSIGHAFVADALELGMAEAVRAYRRVIESGSARDRARARSR